MYMYVHDQMYFAVQFFLKLLKLVMSKVGRCRKQSKEHESMKTSIKCLYMYKSSLKQVVISRFRKSLLKKMLIKRFQNR